MIFEATDLHILNSRTKIEDLDFQFRNMTEILPSISDQMRCTPNMVTIIISLIVIALIVLAILWCCCYYYCCISCKCRTSDAGPVEQALPSGHMQPYIFAEAEGEPYSSREPRLLHTPPDFQTFHQYCDDCHTSSECGISGE